VLSSAMLGCSFVVMMKEKYRWMVCLIVFAGCLLLTYHTWQATGYLQKPESYYSGIYDSTTDTGESSPIWSIRFMERRAKERTSVIDGSAVIRSTGRSTTRHAYFIDVKEPARIVENTLFFPGWHVLVDGKDVTIQFQDPAFRGLMTYTLDSGEHTVDIVFRNTKLRTVAGMISSMGILATIGIFGSILWKKQT
jgi:hypothetical protein